MKRLYRSVLCTVFVIMLVLTANAQHHHRGSEMRSANFVKHTSTVLDVVPIISEKVEDVTLCALSCLENALCLSFNLAAVPNADKYDCQLLATDKYNSSSKLKSNKGFNHYSIKSPCESSPCQKGGVCHPGYEKLENKIMLLCTRLHWKSLSKSFQKEVLCWHFEPWPGKWKCVRFDRTETELQGDDDAGFIFSNKVFCDMTGWTLIARFSNNDTKRWMKDSGEYWYDRKSAVGQTTNPADNTDMISLAFWLVNGTEFKITRSDDSNHTALLQTTGECLGGETFRSKVTSYGNFRNGKTWPIGKCLGKCEVQYSGQYETTDGFQAAECEGNLLQRNKFGFWCEENERNGAVLTIGGAGGNGECRVADHGIGITQADGASLAHDKHKDFDPEEEEYDFGGRAWDANAINAKLYSLNLWVR